MASFEIAIPVILEHEGGFVDNVHDPGGATNYGISLRFIKSLGLDIDLDGDLDSNDVEAMPVDAAKDLYWTFFWYPGEFERINDQDSATKLFDAAVNMGPKQANKLAARSCAFPGWDPLRAPIDAINRMKPPEDFVYNMCGQMTDFYTGLVQRNINLRVFLKGWIRRARWPFTDRQRPIA